MYCFFPDSWEDVIPSQTGIYISDDYSVTSIRDALNNNEKLFIIGADAISESGEWLVVKDHLSLFGSGSLVGPNNPIGPRFPNLRGMYIVPDSINFSCKSGIVMGVPDIKFSTGAELSAFPCDALVSSGLDLAIAAAHGGAKVIFVLNCKAINVAAKQNRDFSFLKSLIQEVKEVRSSEL